jgi:hypothetical protein
MAFFAFPTEKEKRQGERDGLPSQGGGGRIRAKDRQTSMHAPDYVATHSWSKKVPQK